MRKILNRKSVVKSGVGDFVCDTARCATSEAALSLD
jgi:hypothetical protein